MRPRLEVTPRLAAEPGLRLLSYLALLPAGAVDLEAAIERAVATNPALERTPGRHCAGCGMYGVGERCAACSATARHQDHAAEVDWRDNLVREARLEVPARLQELVAATVEALDDHGFLRRTPPGLDERDLIAVLDALRTVGPPGIAASSPVDCVRVQAERLVSRGEAPSLLATLATDLLESVAEGRHAEIAAAVGAHRDEVEACVAILRERTRPFVLLDGGFARARPTDVVFEVSGSGTIRAHVADAGALGVRQVLDELPADPEARRWWAPYRDEAGRLLAAINARATMLGRVADLLAEEQAGFIQHGSGHHRPLRRQDVARKLAVHPSTVGRAVQDKAARCPDGRLLPLAAFFGRTTSLLEQVSAVMSAHPDATDAEVAERLTRSGVPIARRTVAKYRALSANAASPQR
jgi:RNA polymerase sigma-54 factor